MVDERLTVAIPCDVRECSALNVPASRCALPLPVADQAIKWVFALERCPIALACARRLVAIDMADGGRNFDSAMKTPVVDQARALLVRRHDQDPHPPGDRFADHVVAALRQAKTDDAAIDARARYLLGRPGAAQPSIVRRAFIGAVIAVLTLAAFGKLFGPKPKAPVHPPGILSVVPTVPLEGAAPSASFQLTTTVAGPLYVLIHRVGDDGTVERLFPPLDTPAGLPWPIDGVPGEGEEGVTFAVPAKGTLHLPASGSGWIVMSGDSEFLKDIGEGLTNIRSIADVKKRAPGAWATRYEIKTP